MNQSVSKALKLLNLFIENKELTLHEITKKAKMPKPTVYRLLTTLEAGGMLYKTKDSPHESRYGLGLKLLELGELVSERLELRGIALPFMQQLAEEINEVVHLVVVHQQKATYIEKVDSSRALRLNTRIGKSTPLYVGSGPKLLFAFLSEEERESILSEEEEFYIFTDAKPINKLQLRNELNEIRKNKYASSIGEQDPDTTGISYPIINFHNEVVAALAVSGISSHFTGERLEMIKMKTEKTAYQISMKLGFKDEF